MSAPVGRGSRKAKKIANPKLKRGTGSNRIGPRVPKGVAKARIQELQKDLKRKK